VGVSGTARRPEGSGLYDRIGFDPGLEALAYRKLSQLDTEGCREAFARLVEQLDLRQAGRAGTFVLLELLLEVARRVHPPRAAASEYCARREALIGQFGSYDDPEAARRAFLPTLGSLLGRLRPHSFGARALVERAQAYIEDHYQERLSLSRVARELHVSPNYLSRLFRQTTGTTLTAYIHRLRIEHARLLLAAGDRTISEVAYLVGYQTYRDFHRNFVKHERLSPRQAQRRLLARAAQPILP